jgi:5-methyltetrahydrofolate--homocysteine methyltransferase
MESILSTIYDDVLNGQHKAAVSDVKTALELGIPPLTILNIGMISAMQEVGRLFEAGEYYVPEMLIAARAMQAGMAILKPYLSDQDAHPSGKVVLGTVSGDYHDIGKNLVKMMLEGSGFEVIDMGVDVNPEEFIEAVATHQANILAMSALINSTMPNMRIVIESLETSGLRQKVKVLVGGAPLSELFARQISADGYAPDASRAAQTAKSLLNIQG